MKRYTLTFLLMLFIILPLSAQSTPDEEPTPYLIEMLDTVPITDTIVSYVNYSAVEATGITPAPIENYAQFEVDEEARTRWMRRSMRITVGAQFFNTLMQAGDMPAVVGFDIFDIDRAIIFGDPPSTGLVIAGAFDPEAVGAAHAARDYTLNEIEGVEAWCSPDGCDAGMTQDLMNRNPANIFDPQLGRRPPVLVLDSSGLDGMLASAFSDAVARAIANAATDEASSLGDNANYGAAAEALTSLEAERGDLLQAMFVPFMLVDNIDYTIAKTIEDFEKLTGDLMQPFVNEWWNYGDLPPYTLAVLADFQNDAQQSAVIALVYANADDAQTAAEEVSRRIKTFNAAIYTRDESAPSFIESTEGAEVAEPVVYETDDRAVALITVTYPLIDDTNLEGERVSSGMMFRRWIQNIYARGFYPIWQIKLPTFE